MRLEGDFIHEDIAREMFLDLKKVYLSGAIKDAYLSMDVGSMWYATADSNVTFISDMFLNQIDAPQGVTIHAKGAQVGEYALHSGGCLIVTE